MSSNYYAPDFDPWVSNIRRIGTMLQQVPAMRARAAAEQQLVGLRQAETGRATAETNEAAARTRKTDAQTSDIQNDTESGNRLSAALKKVMNDPNDTDATGDAISEFGHYFKKNPEQAAKGMGDLFSHFMAIRGDTNFAKQGSLQGGAASIANNEANNARNMATPLVVPDNSVAIDKTTGQPVATSPQRLSMGQRLFAPGDDNVTLATEPIAQGAPTPAKSSAEAAARSRFIGQVLQKESDPLKQQALIRRYDKQTTSQQRPIDISAAVTPAPQDPDNAPAAPGPTDLVRVQHPDGRTGYIPKANLDAALKNGFKQIAE